MTEPYVRKGREVYANPYIPGDGGAPFAAAIVIPPDHGLHVNGVPVVEQSHEYVLKKKPGPHAED